MGKMKRSEVRAKIKAANSQVDPLSSIILSRELLKNSNYEFECRRFRQLPDSVQNWAFELLRTNVKELYEQSNWGWNSRKKWSELNSSNAWCLLVKKSPGSEIGFVHFRYDLDYGIPVLYLYDIHVDSSERNRGLGGRMMEILRLLAQRAKMEKIVATVFKNNTGSLVFFRRNGFTEDDTNPSDDEDVDYLILSRPC